MKDDKGIRRNRFLKWLMFAPFIFCTGWVLFFSWTFFHLYMYNKEIKNLEQCNKEREEWERKHYPVQTKTRAEMELEKPEIAKMNSPENLTDDEKWDMYKLKKIYNQLGVENIIIVKTVCGYFVNNNYEEFNYNKKFEAMQSNYSTLNEYNSKINMAMKRNDFPRFYIDDYEKNYMRIDKLICYRCCRRGFTTDDFVLKSLNIKKKDYDLIIQAFKNVFDIKYKYTIITNELRKKYLIPQEYNGEIIIFKEEEC